MSDVDLATHLETRYGIRVTGLTELDHGVYRVDRPDGPSWVARVFPTERPASAAEGDATILFALQRGGFPAERCATTEPVSTTDGHPVLVTEFITGTRPKRGAKTFATLGSLLGRLHTRPGTDVRPGGAWHHLVPAGGGPRDEIEAAITLLRSSRPNGYNTLLERLTEADDCNGLPEAFTHPDFVPSNVIVNAEDRMTTIDWTGAGRGPRLWSLAWLLLVAGRHGDKLVHTVLSYYARHVTLTSEEVARLPAVLKVRPLVLDTWSLCTGRMKPAAVLENLSATDTLAEAITALVPKPPTVHRPARRSDTEGSTNLPLPALLSQALVAYTVELDNEFERRMPHRTTNHGATGRGPWLVSLAMWSNCMRYVDETGVTAAELADRARTGTNLAGMLRWGYLAEEDGVLRSTKAGQRARETWQPLFDEIDERWQTRFGNDLADALTTVVSQLPANLPDCLPILGYGLHTKWNNDHPPAPQEQLPLSALLSRTVFAFAQDVERAGTVSMALGMNVLRVLDDKGVRVRDLPTRTGIAKPAVDVSVGFLERNGYATVEQGRGKQIQPTERGQAARKNLTRVLADTEAAWQDKYPTTNLRAALIELSGEKLREGMEPYPTGWRAGVNPPTTLPWYPTVLHRGGYPDGS